MGEVAFTSRGETLTVSVVQDKDPYALPDVTYRTSDGMWKELTDYDTGTYGTGNITTAWLFSMDDPKAGFNRLKYTPAAWSGRVERCSVAVQDDASGGWYTVFMRDMPANGEINFPKVTGARNVSFSVERSSAGATFAAAEIHFINDPSHEEAVRLVVPTSVEAGWRGGEVTATVQANVPYAVAMPADTWLTHQTTGESGQLVLDLQQNNGGAREAVVRIDGAGSGKGQSRQLTIKQQAADAMRLLDPVSGLVTVDAAGSTARVEIATELSPADISCDDALPAWLRLAGRSGGNGRVVLNFTITPNGGDRREHKIRFTGGGATLEVTVEQAAVAIDPPTLSLLRTDPAELSFDAAYTGTFDVVLQTNRATDIAVAGAQSPWLTQQGTPRVSDGTATFTFAVTPNGGAARVAELTFSIADGPRVSVTIKQAAANIEVPYIRVSQPERSELFFGADDAASFDVVLQTNRPSGITVGGTQPPWLTQQGTPSISGGTATFTFAVTPNGGAARVAMLTFTLAGGESASVTVSQAAKADDPPPDRPLGSIVPVATSGYRDLPMMDLHNITEMTDGRFDTYHTVASDAIYNYEFEFRNDVDITTIVYYPRRSIDTHGTPREVDIEFTVRSGAERIADHRVTIPASVFADEASLRAGYRIDLPYRAVGVKMVCIVPKSGYQSFYSVGEVEFYVSD